MQTRKTTPPADSAMRGLRSAKRTVLQLIRMTLFGCLAGLPVRDVVGASQSIVTWGNPSYGVLNVPAEQTNVVAIAAGFYFSMRLNADGTVTAWGDNYSGQTFVPTNLENVVAIAAGNSHSVALKSNGEAVVWGLSTYNGYSLANIPAGLTNLAAVTAGATHTLALTAAGTIAAWGDNTSGQSAVPFGLSDMVAIAAGADHSLALRADGKVVAWGANSAGQSSVPANLTDVVAIAAGGNQSLALKPDGSVTAWGEQAAVPSTATNVSAIASGQSHSLALRKDGTVVAWGWNDYGVADVPSDLTNIVAIDGGANQSLALLGTGPPALVTPLVDRVVPIGMTVRFCAGATGARPLRHQWRFNGTDLLGATNALLSLPAFQPDQAGVYSVVVSNDFGWVIGRDMQLRSVPALVAVPPQAQVRLAGESVAFGVEFASASTPTLQWQFNASDLPGASNAQLNLTNLQPVQAGLYSVVLSNEFGAASSSSALLTVLPLRIVTAPQSQEVLAGETVALTITVQSTAMISYEWQFNGANLPGSTNSVLSLTNVQPNASGSYVGVASNAFGVETSPNAQLSVLPFRILGLPESKILLAGETVTFNVMVQSIAPMSYQWRFNGLDLPGATNGNLRLTNVEPSLGGAYSVVLSNALDTATSSNALLTVLPLRITALPQSQLVVAGQSATFGVTAQGATPFGYQWRFNETDLPGATNAELTLTNVQLAQAGFYSVLVSNAFGAVASSNALLTVQALKMISSPQSQRAVVGQPVEFNVVAQGVAPIIYQWRFNGADLPGATNGVLTLTNIQLGGAGNYSVVVSNEFTTLASLEATLSVGLVAAWGGNDIGQLNVLPGLTNVVAIAAGYFYSLGLNADGTVVGWGDNYSGQTTIPAGLTNVVAIAAGNSHSVALQFNGEVIAWGHNGYAQATVPPGLSNVVAIAAGSLHTMALRTDGTVLAWGNSGNGQTNVPPTATNVVAIAAGANHSLALLADGRVLAWGGQTTVPLRATNVVAIAAGGNHSLALKSDGSLEAWGDQPVVPPDLTNVVAIASGETHNIALRSDTTVAAWGGNSSGQLNIPTWLTNVIAIEGGGLHSLALVGNGPPVVFNRAIPPFLTVPIFDQTMLAGTNAQFRAAALGATPLNYQWRLNAIDLPGATNAGLSLSGVQPAQSGLYSVLVSNALGVARSRDARLTILPLVIESPPRGQTAWVGGMAEFAVTVQSALPVTYRWWFNGTELLGATNRTLTLANVQTNQSGAYSISVSNVFGGEVSMAAPLLVSEVKVAAWGGDFYGQLDVPPGLENCVAIAGGFYHSLALRADGTVAAWGYNASGQTEVPPGLTNVVAVAAGWGHSLALKSDGSVVAWGDNSYGQANVPPGLAQVVAVAAGWGHSLALKSNGRVVAWGWNVYGQTNVPSNLTNAVAIQAGHSHSLALSADGNATAWGYNAFGQTTILPSLTNLMAIAAGWNHNLALMEDGRVIAWGWNVYGQTNVPAGLINVVAIAGGREHSLALTGDGTVTAWGDRGYCQTEVPLGLPNVVMIAGGGYHSLALLGNEPPARRPTLFSPMRTNAAFSVSLPSRSGRVYVLEYKNSLADPNWKAMPLAAGNGGGLQLIDPGATSSQRFYRVRYW